ncbi:MAG: hypothetical protein JNK82_05005 [Myxococcaceae bacterium]|nr:hypothetical protein [Myxococcaceae bacterium]
MAVVLPAGLSGCGGSVCDNAVKAEQAANAKSTSCNVAPITVHDAQRCNSGLSKCSSDDLKELESYGACLAALPACTPQNEIQWRGQRDGCTTQGFFRISLNCFANIL